MSRTPIYKPNKQAGYDPSSRRYRNADGKIIKKTYFNASSSVSPSAGPEQFGFAFNRGVTAGEEASKNYANVIKAAENLEKLITFEDPARTSKVQPIPSDVRAAMRLSSYYSETQGDVWQHLESAIDVSMQELKISCKDAGVERELKDLYGESKLDMWHIMYQAYMCTGTYGVSYPLEIYANPTDPFPSQITFLPPEFVWVGYYINYGMYGGGDYALKPLDGNKVWTDTLIETTIQPMTYNSFGTNWNEQIAKGWGIPISRDCMVPIRSKAFDFNRYPIPVFKRAFRPISTRMVLEEAIRAILEGHRTQLWTFLLGDAEHPPSVEEMIALKSAVTGATGERTGYLAWRGNLKVDVLAPKGLDTLLANDTWQNFSLNIYRALGSNLRIATGNPAGGGEKGGASFEIDLSIWLERLNFMRTTLLRWERLFRQRIAEKSGSPALKKYAVDATVEFSRPFLEVSDTIKNKLVPLYSVGSLSTQTFLGDSGYSYEVELARKKAEEPNAELFGVRPTYSQTTVNPNTPEKKSDTSPKGRTPDSENPKKQKPETVKATWEDEPTRVALLTDLADAIRDLHEKRDPKVSSPDSEK